jgi:hypothetical protein
VASKFIKSTKQSYVKEGVVVKKKLSLKLPSKKLPELIVF